MSRRALLLFSAMSLIWGVPYLLIKVALGGVEPAFLVFARTAIGAVVLLPVALRRRQVLPALRSWRPLLAFATLEIALPWLLLNDAEQHLTSSLSGLLIATVPLIGTLLAWFLGDRTVLGRGRLLGLGVGMAGVAAVVGLDLGSASGLRMAEVVLVAVGYAIAPVIADRHLGGVPPVAVISVSLTAVALAYVPAAVFLHPHAWPRVSVLAAIVALGLVCTAAAFLLFFKLIAEIGPLHSTVITFVNPAVAVALGMLVLREPFTLGVAVGFPLVILGSRLSTRGAGAHAVPVRSPLAAVGAESAGELSAHG